VNENPFLNRVCAKLRSCRPLIPPSINVLTRTELVKDAPFVVMWFRTRGCKYAVRGNCTMCNYGTSTPVPTEDIVTYVRGGLQLLPDNERLMLLISPSGSMFDDWEVPPAAREQIFRMIHDVKCSTVLCETRAETIRDDAIAQYVSLVGHKTACVEIGLESADPWILKYCINKPLNLSKFTTAIGTIRKHGAMSLANILLGSAFLTPREAIEDTVYSVKWALSQGADRCIVLPAHVKPWTLLHWLWERNIYSPPSLWSLVEVLARLGPELTPKVIISWYKPSYYESAEGDNPVEGTDCLSSPLTCATCKSTVVKLLDDYHNTQNFSTIQTLVGMQCECRIAWRRTLEKQVTGSLAERVTRFYEAIGHEILGTDWWTHNRQKALAGITR